MPEQPTPVSLVAILVGVGAAALLLVVLFFRSDSAPDLSVDQRAMASALVNNLNNTGVLIRHDCAQNVAYVNGPLWTKFNREQRRNLTLGLATACDNERAGYRIRVLDDDTSQELAAFDGRAFSESLSAR